MFAKLLPRLGGNPLRLYRPARRAGQIRRQEFDLGRPAAGIAPGHRQNDHRPNHHAADQPLGQPLSDSHGHRVEPRLPPAAKYGR